MNVLSSGPSIVFYPVEKNSFLLNNLLISKGDLVLFLEMHGYEIPSKYQTEIEFYGNAFKTLVNMEYTILVESLEWFVDQNRQEVNFQVLKSKLILDNLDNN